MSVIRFDFEPSSTPEYFVVPISAPAPKPVKLVPSAKEKEDVAAKIAAKKNMFFQ